MARLRAWPLLAVTHLAACIAGWTLAERELLAENVEYTGVFSTETKKTLAAAVLSLRKEAKLLVYTYRGAAHVVTERSELLGLAEGKQWLTVPATVAYYVELSELGVEDVDWDETAKAVTVHIPPLVMGEVALHAEAAYVLNVGVLTYSDRHVQDLMRVNYATARRAYIKQAQDKTLVANAEAQARENIERHFELVFRIAGRTDVRVFARIEER